MTLVVMRNDFKTSSKLRCGLSYDAAFNVVAYRVCCACNLGKFIVSQGNDW